MYLLCRIWRVLKQSYSGFVLCIAFEFQRRKSSLCRVSVFHYFRYWKKPFFLDIFTLIGDILKNLWPLFMDGVQLFWGYAEPLWGDTLLFTTHFSGVSGTHLMDLGRMIGGIFSWKNKTLWPPYMDGVHFSQDYRVIMRKQFTFYLSVLRSSWYSLNQGRIKGWVDFGTTKWFWTWDIWIGSPVP